MARKSLHRIGAQLLRPAPEHVLIDLQIPRRLRHADATLPDQSDRLNLKFSRKHSPSHGPPPASAITFSRCPRNRQQATRSDDRYPHSIGLGEPPSMTSTASGSESGLKVAV